jgi:ATP-dependent RNA helicase DHX29
MDIPLRDRILALAPQPSSSSTPEVSFASLYPALGPSSLPTALLARALTTHALLLRLGFNAAQADEALRVAGVDVEEAAAYLYATLPDDEADAARARCNRGERDETAEDTTLPPQHPGYTFERTVPTRAAAPAPRVPAAAAAPLDLSPGELAVRREALRAKLREVNALAAELSSAWAGVEPLEDPNGSWGRARAGIVRIDRTSAQLAKAKVAANESEAQPALRAEVADAEKRLVAIKAEVESVREQAGRGKWFDKKAGEEAFRAEVARVELLEKEREEKRRVEKAELEDGSVDEESSTPAASAASTAAPEEATPQSTAPPSAAPSGAPSEAGDAASDDDAPMFGDMLDEAPTEQTDEATGELITVYPLPAAALRGGGGGKMPRALLGEALRRIDPASSARFEQRGGRSVCRSRLHLRWTPPGAQKAVLDVFTLTTLAAGSPSAADELLAVLALSCIERERHVERGLGKGWREWWDELEVARASERDARRRTHVARIGELVAPRLEEERKKDEEKARLKREKAAAAASSGGLVSHADVDGSGAVTPAEEQRDVQAPAPGRVYREEEAEAVRAMWQRRTSEQRYAAMLVSRAVAL